MDSEPLGRRPSHPNGLTAVGSEDGPCVLVSMSDHDEAWAIAHRLADRGWRALVGGLTSDFAPGFRAIVSDDPPTLLFGEAVWPEALIVAAMGPRSQNHDFRDVELDWKLKHGAPLSDDDSWGPLGRPPTL